MNTTLRNPRQASRIYGLDQVYLNGGLATGGVPRPKFLFLARFLRSSGTGAASDWQFGMTFAMKQMDRPKVTPELQTIRQYNKKRVIQTGIKYSPVRFEFYDTVDAPILRMWDEYSKYYFGDFRSANGSEWTYDVTNGAFLDYGTGFGVTLPQGNDGNAVDRSAGYFFDKIECYQFFGGTYIQYDLIHPKISSFDPDNMDYSDIANAHSISMTMEYESLIYHNSSIPAPIQNAAIYPYLVENFYSDAYDPPYDGSSSSSGKSGSFLENVISQGVQIGSSIVNNKVVAAANKALGINSSTSILNSFGSFNFGSVGNTIATQVLGGLQTQTSTTINTTTSQAVANISNSTLSTINANRSAGSQIGARTDNSSNNNLDTY